jgi:ribonuclease T1
MVMRRRNNPLLWLVAAFVIFAGALWQQRAEGLKGTRPASVPQASPAGAPATTSPSLAPAPATPAPPAASSAWPGVNAFVPRGERVQLLATLELIQRGGPFPYDKDGSVFGNRERKLPARPRGYYREYTVPTPNAPNRGTRRVVQGRDGDTWYTSDHYRTFVRIDE